MSRLLSFFIPCVPPKGTAQGKGIRVVKHWDGRMIPMMYKKKTTQAAEDSLISLLTPHAPKAPFTGPLWLTVGLFFPWRKGEGKRVMAAYAAVPIETKPDCSNLIKMLEDAMTRLNFWKDDSQNAGLTVTKYYSDRPGIFVDIESVSPVKRVALGQTPKANYRILQLPDAEGKLS